MTVVMCKRLLMNVCCGGGGWKVETYECGIKGLKGHCGGGGLESGINI